MKIPRIRFALSLLVCLAVLVGGCLAPQSPKSLENKSKAVTWAAAVKVLEKHPDWRPQFVQARDDLQVLAQSETIGIVEILAIVHRLPISELRDGDMAIVIGATMMFFEDEVGQVALDNPEWLRAVVRGMAQGLNLAIPSGG